MHSPLQLITESHFSVSGNVTIHPTAAIAPGVLLQADPESELVICAGVCIGMGAVLHANAGRLEIGYGVSLGAGVLIVGSGRIGNNACIGAMTTLIVKGEGAIEPDQVIPFGSLLGDESRQLLQLPGTSEKAESNGALNGTGKATPAEEDDPWGEVADPLGSVSEERTIVPSETATPLETAPSSEPTPPPKTVYGLDYVNRMIHTMFPHKQSLNSLSSDPPSLPGQS